MTPLSASVSKKMKISLVTCVFTINLPMSMGWGKHFIIKTKDAANNNEMAYPNPTDIYGLPEGKVFDYGNGHGALRPPRFGK